uniref:Lebercilin domain-containing protein n=1 Tax=Clastoptera arizonana TaxID=38151 RepID=A0A1B6CW02_9HEMI
MEQSTSILRVLTDISEVKSNPGDIKRPLIDVAPHSSSREDLHGVQTTRLLKKNQLNPILGVNNPYRASSHYGSRMYSSSRGKVSDFTQRIMSAKLLRVKELRNQLAVTQHQVNELTNENRLLKTMQKRQETALRKYEGTEARLPQLMQSHNEEMRILTSKLKQLKTQNQKLCEKLKNTETHLNNLQEQHVHLLQLTRDRNLGEREQLANQVQELQASVQEQNDLIQILNRKVDLERKNYKHELSIEVNKRRDVEHKYSMAVRSIDSLKDQIEPMKKPTTNPISPDTHFEFPSISNVQIKEKYINSYIPRHNVRKMHSQSNLSHDPVRSQQNHVMPRAPQESTESRTDTSSQVTNQSGDETDVAFENGSGIHTTDSSKTKMTKIKERVLNKSSHYKLSLNQKSKKDKSSIEDTNAEYSSSLQSSDASLQETFKTESFDSGKSVQRKRLITIPTRRFSIDSSVTNKTDRSISEKTECSQKVDTNSRRNSLSVYESNMDNIQDLLNKDVINKQADNEKSMKDELRELEEKLLIGSNLFRLARKSKFDNKDMLKNDSKHMVRTTSHDSNDDDDDEEKLGDSVSWNELQEKIQAERQQTEAKLEEYYNNIMKTDYNLANDLHDGQKEKLLTALKNIDKETQGRTSSKDSDENLMLRNEKYSDGYSYNFSKTVENLHLGLPAYEKIRIPVVEKMKREEKEYMSTVEANKIKKSDLMKELFGSFNKIEDNGENFTNNSNIQSSNNIKHLVQNVNLHET